MPGTSPSTVLVTGGAGFIGSHCAETLLERGHRVIVYDNLASGRRENLSRIAGQVEFIEADILDEQAVGRCLAQHTPVAVLHLAGMVNVARSIEEPEANFRINVQGTEIVARLAARHGCRRVVFASSASVYGANDSMPLDEDAAGRFPPLAPYAAAKLSAEAILAGYGRCFGFDAISLRLFNVYGPRQDPASPYSGVVSILLDRLRRGLPVEVHGSGDQSRDFVHVDDVAIAASAAIEGRMPPGAYNVCTGVGVSVNDLVRELAAHFGTTRVNHGPVRKGDIPHSRGSHARLARALGDWAPRGFADGLGRLVAGQHGGKTPTGEPRP